MSSRKNIQFWGLLLVLTIGLTFLSLGGSEVYARDFDWKNKIDVIRERYLGGDTTWAITYFHECIRQNNRIPEKELGRVLPLLDEYFSIGEGKGSSLFNEIIQDLYSKNTLEFNMAVKKYFEKGEQSLLGSAAKELSDYYRADSGVIKFEVDPGTVPLLDTESRSFQVIILNRLGLDITADRNKLLEGYSLEVTNPDIISVNKDNLTVTAKARGQAELSLYAGRADPLASQKILVDELGLEFGNPYYVLEEGKRTEVKLYSTIPFHQLKDIHFSFAPEGSIGMEEVPVSPTKLKRDKYERTLLLSLDDPKVGDVTLTASCLRDYGVLEVFTLLKIQPLLVECPRPSRTFPLTTTGITAVLGFMSFSKNSDANDINDDFQLAQAQGASISEQESLISDYDDAIEARDLYMYLSIGAALVSGYLWYDYLGDKREYEDCAAANEQKAGKPILKVSMLPVPQVSVQVRF